MGILAKLMRGVVIFHLNNQDPPDGFIFTGSYSRGSKVFGDIWTCYAYGRADAQAVDSVESCGQEKFLMRGY